MPLQSQKNEARIFVTTSFEQNRINNINFYLNKVKEVDISDQLIRKINRKFPKTINYVYVRREQLEIGNIIAVVDLELKKLSIPGLVIDFKSTSSKSMGVITLYSNLKDIYWNINPTKYFIFKVQSSAESDFKQKLLELKRILELEKTK
jgi:hypothetical protein